MDDFIVAHNGEFISKVQLNPIKLHLHVYRSDTSYFNKVTADHW